LISRLFMLVRRERDRNQSDRSLEKVSFEAEICEYGKSGFIESVHIFAAGQRKVNSRRDER
jgi:hypothetical protein